MTGTLPPSTTSLTRCGRLSSALGSHLGEDAVDSRSQPQRQSRNYSSNGLRSPIGPGQQTFDFRVDMFNAFNHPIFQLPNGSMATANAGKVTDTAAPRQIMFGFRYSF